MIKRLRRMMVPVLVTQTLAAGMPALGMPGTTDLTSLSLEELCNLEVTSVSKTPQKFLHAAAAIYVITQDDIRRAGVTSIPEALRLAPGVQVARINSNQWSVGVRGFGDRLSRSVLVLIDGRAVYSPLFAGTFWEVQDYVLADIDRIEVIRGPGGTLYGANAVNGVINIITKSAKDTQGGLVTAGGGSEERGFTSMRYGGKKGADLNYRFYGKYFNRGSSFHADGDNFDAWQMGQSGFRADWDGHKKDTLTLQGDLYKGKAGQQLTVATYPAPFAQTLEQDSDLFGANILGRWKHAFSAASDTALQWYYDRTSRMDPNYREFRNTFDLDFQHHWVWSHHQELTWGLGYRLTSNLIDSIPTIVFDPQNRTDHLASAFVQNQMPLIDDVLKLTLGTKVEHNDFSGWETEPSGRLAWTPTPAQTFWTSGSRAVRTPSQVEQDLQATLPVAAGAPLFVRQEGNKNFQSEKLTAYEWGYRVQPLEPLFMDIAAFYNRYDNLITAEIGAPALEFAPTPVHAILPAVLGNNLEGETHGVEWASTWNALSWWRWRANYSLMLIHLRLKPDSLDTTNRVENTEGASPRHQAAIQWSMDLPAHVEWDPTVRYVDHLSHSSVDANVGIPTYWEMDMRLGWHATSRLELSLVGQNLFHNHHAEADPTQELQRGVYTQATWTW